MSRVKVEPAALDCIFRETFLNSSKVGSNNGTVVGTPTITNNQYYNDGTSGNYITYKPDSSFLENQIRTISFWYKGTSDTFQTVLSMTDGSDYWYLALGPATSTLTNEIISVIAEDPDDADSIRLGYTTTNRDEVFDGKWHYITITMDGTSNSTKIYLDGALKTKTVAATKVDIGYVPVLNGTWNVARLHTDTAFLNGSIKDLLISDREYIAQEVQDLYYNVTFDYEDQAVFYLPLNDQVGGAAPYTTTDIIAGNNITLGNGSTASTFPTKLSNRNGYSFDGGDYLKLTTSNFRGSDSQGSLSIWLKAEDIGGTQTFFSSSDESVVNKYLRLLLLSTGEISIIQNSGVATADRVDSARGIIDGSVHHVVITSDGATYKLYIDGEEDPLSVVAGVNNGNWFADIPDRDNLVVGALIRNSGIEDIFNGNIISVKILDRTLTPTQIRDLHSRGSKYFGL